MACLLGPRSWKGTHTLCLTLCGRNSWLHSDNSRHVDFHRSCTARFESLQSPSTTHLALWSKRSMSHHSVLVCFPHRSLSARSISRWLLSLGVCSCRVHPCASRAHLAVMVTPRTLCHFTKQARALRVPELCDDHTPPSCLATNSLAKLEHRSVNTLVLPDPLLTQAGDIPSVCIALAFRQVVRLGASWPVLCTCLCLHTPQLVAAPPFSACGCLLAPQSGITFTIRAIRSQHYTLFNS